MHESTRRDLFRWAGASAAALSLAAGPDARRAIAAEESATPPAAPPGPASATPRDQIDTILRQRALSQVAARTLVVDYYRIRRRLAYPLPVTDPILPDIAVPGLADYPWNTWLIWALEERVHSLAWAAAHLQDTAAREALSRDLAALAMWPRYRQYAKPDLLAGHTGRLFWAALTQWTWLDAPVQQALREACSRYVDDVAAESDRAHGAYKRKEDILALPDPHPALQNIPFIGTIGAALAAGAIAHPAIASLDERVALLVGAALDLREKGFTEGVGYDGYVLDFVADWIPAVPAPPHPAAPRAAILAHPGLRSILQESCHLAAPGDVACLAEIGDVEPREMPFHACAQAKLLALDADPLRAWYLSQYRLDWLRADALAALRDKAEALSGAAPAAAPASPQYAAVLRSGWEPGDLAVAVACHASPMGHLHADNGSLVIATRGQWLIADPGYQQYMPGDEREFTIGPCAHNAPVINGHAQSAKAGRLVAIELVKPGLQRLTVDMAACYNAEAQVHTATRTVWLFGRQAVVVADHVVAESPASLAYHWHGAPCAAWWLREGAALLHLPPDVSLWLVSPQAHVSDVSLIELKGSRGHLSLAVEPTAGPIIWWLFALGEEPPPYILSADESKIEAFGERFSA